MNDWIWPWLVAFGLTRARCVYRGGRVAARWPARIGVFALLAATQFWLVAAHAEALLPVWALIDQDTPVAGARVRVLANGRPVRQLDGRLEERTNENGVVGLEFESLPSSFTVVASGGRVDGLRLGGTLTTRIDRHEAGTIVYVNPLTSLAAELRERRPNLTADAAARQAKRRLGLPRWHNLTMDLQRSDRWFGGDAFLKYARQRGGVERLLDQFADKPDMRRRFRDPQHASGAVANALPGIVKDLAAGLIQDYVPATGQVLLGKLLGLFGLGDLLDSSDIEEIRGRFDAVDAQLAEIKESLGRLETKLDRTNYNVLVGSTSNDIADIDTAYSKLVWLSRMDPSDSTRTNYGKETLGFIQTRIVPVPSRLNQKLGGSVQLADNVLTAASRLVATSAGRFFGSDDSALARSVYEYYALAQARAGVLLLSYWTANPTTFSQATIAYEANQITNAIGNQESKYLKPPVPSDVFIDQRNNAMWTRTLVRRLDGLAFDRELLGKTQTFAGFNDFRVPSFAELRQLTDGRTGNDPAAWLRQAAKLSAGVSGLLWAADSLPVEPQKKFCGRSGCTAGFIRLMYRFNLSTGETNDLCPIGSRGKCVDRRERDVPTSEEAGWLQRQSALVIYRRPLRSDESYWFK